MLVSLAWFPRGEWEEAIATWPDLLEDLPADHTAYCHRIEARMKRLARSFAGHPMRVAPITVDGLTTFCEAEEEDDPGTAEARSSYAAQIARHGDARVATRAQCPLLVRVRPQVQDLLWTGPQGARMTDPRAQDPSRPELLYEAANAFEGSSVPGVDSFGMPTM